MTARLSIIVPTLNEGAVIESLLQRLQPLRRLGHELVVSDGGSEDDTCSKAEPLVDQLVYGAAGRALQLSRGAAAATGNLLWFVHADTQFRLSPESYLPYLLCQHERWGFCALRLDHPAAVFGLIGRMISLRSRFSCIGTGDQGLFVSRSLYDRVGGFAEIPLMEDVELCKRLRCVCAPAYIPLPLVTSARRWQRGGIARTVLLMWRLRLAYFLGVPVNRLAEHYRLCSSPTQES